MIAIIKPIYYMECFLAKRIKSNKQSYKDRFINKTKPQVTFEVIGTIEGSYEENIKKPVNKLFMVNRSYAGTVVSANQFKPIELSLHKCDTKGCKIQVYMPIKINNKKVYLCRNCERNDYIFIDKLYHKNNVVMFNDGYRPKSIMQTTTNEMKYCKQCRIFYRAGRNCNCNLDIHNWHNTQGNHFYHLQKEDKKNRYFGLEHEIASRATCYEDMVQTSNNLGRKFRELTCKEDGSISGFEIVFQPMTLKYAQSLDWFSYMRTVKDYGMGHSSSCGIHIHVNKESISKVTLYKLFRFFESNLDNIFILSERKWDNLQEWSRWSYNNGIMETIYDQQHDERYVMINLQPEKTIEFRFFNGTSVANKVIGRIEIIASLLKYIEAHETNKLYIFNNYINYVLKNEIKYPIASKILVRLFNN